MLFGGVVDELGSYLRVLHREARGGSGDPTRPFHHLLAKVSKQAPVVLDRGLTALEALDDRDGGELALECRPHEGEFLDQPASLSLTFFIDGSAFPID